VVSKTLYDCIGEILNNGTTKPKEIKEILQKQYGKSTTLNSIYAIKSNIGKSKQGSNVNANHVSNSNNFNSSSEMARTQQEQPEAIPQEIQTQEEPQIQTPIPQTQNQPIKHQVITGQKFNLNGVTAPIQIEGVEMSKAYSDNQIAQEELSNPTPTFPIKVHKLGNVSGDLVQAMYQQEKMKKLTSNYEVTDSDVKDLNQDVTEMIQYRIGDSVNHADGDIINVALDFGLIFAKSMAHKIKNKKKREMVESLTKEAEVNVKAHLQEGAKQMVEMKKQKEKIKNSLCNNCNQNPIEKNGLCQECYFSQKVQKGQEEFSG
jgi:hypothetical protein